MHIEVRPGWEDRQSEDINSRTSALIFQSVLKLAAQLLVVFSLVHVDLGDILSTMKESKLF